VLPPPHAPIGHNAGPALDREDLIIPADDPEIPSSFELIAIHGEWNNKLIWFWIAMAAGVDRITEGKS
jgi:hypothetical protein